MKPFFVSASIVILITFNLSATMTHTDNILRLSYSQQEQEIVREQTTAAATNNTMQGTLVVTTKVNNEGGGSSQPSDFTIKVHGNNPSNSSFPGNSSGTIIKLDMGMYSVTASGPPFYNSTSSMDCSGAVMSAETIKCEISNTYVKPK